MTRLATDMRALLLDRPGAPDTLRLGKAHVPRPRAGEILVRVEACGLNPVDYKVASGGVAAWTWPHILGLDVVGIVEAIGDGVTSVEAGSRVAYHGDLRRAGGFAEYSCTTADTVAHVPEGVSATDAAALPCAGMTAYQAVDRRLHVGTNDTVLVTAGAGGVGGFAIQLAARAGARVITTASAPKADWVRALGAAEVIDYTREDVATQVRRLTDGHGVDAVVDTLGGSSATQNLALLAFGGGIATIDGRASLSAIPPFTIAPSTHEIALGAAHEHGDARARRELSTMLSELLAMLARHELSPMISDVLPLDRVPKGLSALAGRHVTGKLVFAAS